MTTPQLDALDSVAARISELREATRQALINGDQGRTLEILGQLKSTETAWHALIATSPAGTLDHAEVPAGAAAGFALPAREQIHRVLSLISVPARPTLIQHVHKALFPGDLSSSSFTSLRRDEERSYNLAKGPRRPYYIVPALSTDDLTPVRGLLALSTWAPERRIVGPHSELTDYLSTASAVAHAVMRLEAAKHDPEHPAWHLLEGVASGLNIGPELRGNVNPTDVINAVYRRVHETESEHMQDLSDRRRGADLLAKLSPAEQLFGKQATV
jgi:hypothetical protein